MNARFIALTCILGIVITAPVGQFIIQILGNNFLKKTISDNNDGGYPTVISNLSSNSQSYIDLDTKTTKNLFKENCESPELTFDFKHQVLSVTSSFPNIYLVIFYA